MIKRSIVFFIVLIITGISLIYFFASLKLKTPYESSLAPFYQILGNSGKTFDSIIGKVLPVNELDEKKYGDIIASYYADENDINNKDLIYLNSIVENLQLFTKKDFDYRIFINKSSTPNAYAFPGGVIFVTEGLLELLDSENELVAILAHEIGHVELSHCFNGVKYEMVTQKIDNGSIGEIFDIVNNYTLGVSFSKTQENEADDYAYRMLLLTDYNPDGLGSSFNKLDSLNNSSINEADIIRDYESSHMPLKIRAEKFSAMSEIWWSKNPDSVKYRGVKNLEKRVSYYQKRYFNETK